MSDACKVCGGSELAIKLEDDAIKAAAEGYAVTIVTSLDELVPCPCRDVKRLTAVLQMLHDNCGATLKIFGDADGLARGVTEGVKAVCRDALDGGDGKV